MNSKFNIISTPFSDIGIKEIEATSHCKNWPVVYLLHNDKNIYVGETTSAITRMEQHLEKTKDNYCLPELIKNDWKSLNIINIIDHEEFNKSAILDFEQLLIKFLKTDGRFAHLLNRNDGHAASHDYFNRNEYRKIFIELWNKLRTPEFNIASRTYDEILNDKLFKYSPFTALNPEQYDISLKILNDICDKFENDFSNTDAVALIRGNAGTGKTILGVNIINSIVNATQLDEKDFEFREEVSDKVLLLLRLKRILKNKPNLKIGIVYPQSSIRETISKVFKQFGNGLSPSMVLGPTDVVKEKYDILIVDEAHRLSYYCGGCGSKNDVFQNNSKKLGLDYNSCSQIDWIIKQAKYKIFFYDQDQSVRNNDIKLENVSNSFNPYVVSEINQCKSSGIIQFDLHEQMRCNGGQTYIQYIKNILECKQLDHLDFKLFDFKIFNDPEKLFNTIKKLDEKYGLCRTVAGISWIGLAGSQHSWKRINELWKDPSLITKKGIKIIDHSEKSHNFIWNLTTIDWINSPHSIDTLGCIHTIQGYDLNYVGVIFGEEIKYDPINNEIIVVPQNFKDIGSKRGISKNPKELKKYIINIYTTLLSRGVKGCYVYACDKNLHEYLKKYINEYKPS